MDVCKTCRYWDRRQTAEGYGVCRVNPPMWHPDDAAAGSTLGEWPQTQATDWCGMHEVKSEAHR